MSEASNTDLFVLSSSVLPSDARVVGFRGSEALSQLYRFSVGVITQAAEIDLMEARGMAATLKINGGEEPYQVHGMIVEATLRHAWQGHALYQIVLAPKAWVLTMSHYCRVFVDTAVPDIITTLLEAGGLTSSDFELRLQGKYKPHLHTCQYKESRWAFISRLMQREGLYYFFEQGEQAEKLIITDHRSYHEPLRKAAVRYVPLSGTDNAMGGEALQLFTSKSRTTPRATKLRDFDYLNPSLDVASEETIWEDSAAAQVHIGEHDFRTEGDGQPKALAMAESYKATELTFEGRGRVFGLRAGYRFNVEEHPLDSINAEYLAVGVRHQGVQAIENKLVAELLGLDSPDDYRVEVEAVSAEQQWRSMRRIPTPRVSGVERAFVDGPADSDYAQIDEHGRYKVKFHFDIDDSEQWDGNASTWIRMLQPHGGGTEGFHFPLRKNTEVLVVFLGGDPDRPVIAGAVPNATQPSPVVKDNHSQNWIQTGGASRIEIEDQEGKKYVDIFTPPENTFIHLGIPHDKHTHTIHINTEGNEFVNIGGNKDVEIGGPQKEHVAGAVTENYDATMKITVGASLTEDVGAAVTETYSASHTTNVSGPRAVTIGGGEGRDVTGTWRMDASGFAILRAPTTHVFGTGSMLIDSPSTQQSLGALKFFTATTQLGWGPTTGNIASLNIAIPGGATINAPGGWTVNAPADKWQFGFADWVGSQKTAITAIATGITGLKAEACGIAIELKGASGVTAGVKARKGGAETTAKGPVSVGAAIWAGVTGMFSVS